MSDINSNLIHSFNIHIAEKLNINCAIILFNLEYWINRNIANNTNLFEDSYWTYNSVSAFKKLFPYLTEYQIRNSLKQLEEENIIKTGNFNKVGYDRTLWYAITEYGYSILRNHQIHLSKTTNAIVENNTPIPDINTDINTVSNTKVTLDKVERIPFQKIISYLNKETGSKFQNVEGHRKFIRHRWNEGYRLEDFKKVIDNKKIDWTGKTWMHKGTLMSGDNLLRPQTLFGDKFDTYLNEVTKTNNSKLNIKEY